MREADLMDGRVNAMIGTALGVGFITPKQFIYCGIIFFFCIPYIYTHPLQGVMTFALIYGNFWALTGNDPSVFFERWIRPKRYIAEEPTLGFTSAGIPRPVQLRRDKTTYIVKKEKRVYRHIERKWNFLTPGQIELDGKEVGFYLLRRGPQLLFVFAWEVSGHDPSVTTEQSFDLVCKCTDALNALPKDIDLKAYQDIRCSCDEYLRMQADLLTVRKHDLLSQELIKSRAKRGRDLAAEGRLLENKITYFAKFRVSLGSDYAEKQTWIDEVLAVTQPVVGALKGKNLESRESWERVLDTAYRYAYRKVNSLLTSTSGFGMRVRTLDVHQLYGRDYLELHEPPVPEVPQYIVYKESGLQTPVINDPGIHTIGTFFEPEGGYPAVPLFDRHIVRLPSKDKYAGFVRIGQVRSFPKDKGNVPRGYMRYLWNILAGSEQPIYDCRIVTELTPDRSGFEVFQLDKLISNSVKRQDLATKKKTIDVVAERRILQATQARDLIEEKNIPYWCSVGIWVYRDSANDVAQACDEIVQRVTSAKAERSFYDVEDIWFQTWPFEWQAFLTKPNHHRQKYLSFQTLPLLPLIKPKRADKKGVMFVTREMASPLYIDIAGQKNHTAIIAKTGTGKSNVLFDCLIEYLLWDYLAVIFDFPRPDGTSTYTEILPVLQALGVKAAYHNVRESVINILEWPDLRWVKNKKNYERRWQQAFQNHVRLLCALVMGVTNNPDRELLVNSFLTDCYASFLEDPSIAERYRIAIEGGFGSEAYQQMPILGDFVDFAEAWFDDYIERKGKRISTLGLNTIDIILTQFRGLLRTPLGASINGISSFDTDVRFLVIGLTDVSENLDSLIYAMSGLNVLMRRSLSVARSLLAIDEGTILYKMHFFARETGTIPVHGRKWGCNFLLAAQEILTILKSCSGNEIFKNLDNVLCGHIKESAIAEMVSLGFREELLRPYTSESYKPSFDLLQSYWYLMRGDQHLEVTHPVSELLLGLGATEPEENRARQRVMSLHPGDPISGFKEFATLNAQAKRQGLPMDSIYPNINYEEHALR